MPMTPTMPHAQRSCADRGQLEVPGPVITETAWQVERNLGPLAEAQFLRLITTGQIEVID